jgi:hypothetical protein
METLISSDDSVQARKAFNVMRGMEGFKNKFNRLDQSSISEAKGRFVTGSTGETLRAANLLQQLSGSQTGLK